VFDSPPFRDVYQALAFYNHHNPARLKSINVLERETKGSNSNVDSIELWSVVCVIIWRVLRPIHGSIACEGFKRWYMVSREDRAANAASKEDLARELNVSLRTLNRHINKALLKFEKELRHEGLIQTWGIA
jgi:hypothetical protein